VTPARLFVYGTLQDETVVARVVGRRLPWRTAVLEGYCRTVDETIGYPVVLPSPGSRVDGRLLEPVDAAAFAALDEYEGSEYRRVILSVLTSERRAVDAFAYVPRNLPLATIRGGL
jgi:gamma-glutamylcyclotransferase (GGCT)/AIG2-like uncharacterized protein YtfP